MTRIIILAGVLSLLCQSAIPSGPARAKSASGRARIPDRTGTPYLGAIVVNAETGDVVFEDNADAQCYPASIIKLMDLLLIEEKIQQHTLTLSDKVPVTAHAARIGGSQVYLKEKEAFPLEELLYALMVQSANDAATALALHIAGSTESFVGMMQEKADALGMKQTAFHTVHGLPPAKDQEPDVSSPRDLVTLARALLKYPDALRYTSTQVRGFRNGTMEMRNHNRLLGSFDGCDGLKTGYFKLGGYSIVATAKRGGNRFISVVAGSKEKKVRDTKARELLSRAFSTAHPKAAAAPALEPSPRQPQASQRHPQMEKPAGSRGATKKLFLLVLVVAVGAALYVVWRRKGIPPTPPPGVHYQLK